MNFLLAACPQGAAGKVQGDRNEFLRSSPNAKPVTAGKDVASNPATGRSSEAISDFIAELMAAFRDKDMTTLQRLSAGSAIGWLSPEEAKEVPSPAPAGLSMPRLEEVVKNLQEKYAQDVQILRDVQAVESRGDWVAARIAAPRGKNDGQPLVTVVLQRLPAGWRMIDVGDAKGPLPEDMERRAKALAELEAALANLRQEKEAAIAKEAARGASATQPAAEANDVERSLRARQALEEIGKKQALAYLEQSRTDTSRHDMSKPESIQRITVSGQEGWRIAWRLKNFTGKGGQLIVIVWDSGKIDLGYGE